MSRVLAEVEYFSRSHVHTWDDGRGPRRVFVDNVELVDVTYADSVLGIAVMAAQPVQLLPGTEYIDQVVMTGDVLIEPVVT